MHGRGWILNTYTRMYVGLRLPDYRTGRSTPERGQIRRYDLNHKRLVAREYMHTCQMVQRARAANRYSSRAHNTYCIVFSNKLSSLGRSPYASRPWLPPAAAWPGLMASRSASNPRWPCKVQASAPGELSAVGSRILLADADSKQKVSAMSAEATLGDRVMVPIERRTQCMLLSASFNPEPVSLTPRLMAEA